MLNPPSLGKRKNKRIYTRIKRGRKKAYRKIRACCRIFRAKLFLPERERNIRTFSAKKNRSISSRARPHIFMHWQRKKNEGNFFCAQFGRKDGGSECMHGIWLLEDLGPFFLAEFKFFFAKGSVLNC